MACIAFFALFDFPETAGFLNEDERAFVMYRLKYQGQSQDPNRAQVAQADEFKWKYVKDAFLDWQIWVNIFVYWGVSGPPPFVHTRPNMTVAGRLPPLRHLTVPPHHYPPIGLQEQPSPADDR